jgi:hypothetical protein
MPVTGTIEQAPRNAYYLTDVLSGDILLRTLSNNSWLFGDGSNNTSTLRVNKNMISSTANVFTHAGNFGVSNMNPQYTLDVEGDINFTGTFMQNGVPYRASPWLSNGGSIYYNLGNTGIGTSNPLYSLHVTDTSATSNLVVNNVMSIPSSGTINIGTDSNTNTVNIGGTNTTVNISGTLSYVTATDLTLTDKRITLNKNGAANTANDAGIEFEENGVISGYIKTSSDRNSFLFKTPNANNDLTLNLQNDVVNFNNNLLVLNNSNSRIGVGTNNPGYTLEVQGVIHATSNILINGEPLQVGYWYSTGTSYNWTQSNTSIGTNTNQNSTRLFVSNTGTTNTGMTGDGTNVNSNVLSLSDASINRIVHKSGDATTSTIYNYESNKNVYWGEATDTGYYSFRGKGLSIGYTNTPGSSYHLDVNGSANISDRLFVTNTMSLGTTNTPEKLTLSGGNMAFIHQGAYGGNGQTDKWISIGERTQTIAPQFQLSNYGISMTWDTDGCFFGLRDFGTGGTLDRKDTVIAFGDDTNDFFRVMFSNSADYLTVSGLGNVGINNSDPQYRLDVNGDINFTGTFRQNGNAYVGSQWSNNGNNLFITGSNVGIGTSSPSRVLHVVGDVQFDSNVYFTNTQVAFTGIRITQNTTGITNQVTTLVTQVPGYTWDSNILLSAAFGCNITISSMTRVNSFLGVNMTGNPAYALDVNGDINFSGTFRQNGTPYIGSQWSNSTGTVFVMNSNVGINDSNPIYNMSVGGDMNYTGTLRKAGTAMTPLTVGTRLVGSNMVPGYPIAIGTTSCNNFTFSNAGSYIQGASAAFDHDNTTFNNYDAMGGYNSVSGLYSGSAPTTNGVSGAWIQIQSTSAFAINGYDLAFPGTSNVPSEWYVFGSTNGTSWTQVDYRAETWSNAAAVIGSISLASTTSAFNYYRLVFNKVKIGGTTISLSTLQYHTPSNVPCVFVPSSVGFMGVNNSNPAYPLDVVGDINFTGTFRQNGTPYVGSQWSNNASNVFINGSNIGIGTSTPQRLLHVAGDVRFDSNIFINNTSVSFPGLMISKRQSGGSANINSIITQIPGYTWNSNISLTAASTCNIILNSITRINSNLGIGKSPSYALDVLGDINFSGTFRQGGTPYVGSQWTTSNNHIFITGSNVGISWTTPTYPLEVDGDVRVGNLLQIGRSNAATILRFSDISKAAWQMTTFGYVLSFQNNSNATNTWETRMTLTGSGNLGIGQTNPQYRLDVSGDINFTGTLRQNGNTFVPQGYSYNQNVTLTSATNCNINLTGNVSATGTVSMTRNAVTLTITPGSRSNVNNSSTVTYDISGTGTHFFWDDLEASGNITSGNNVICSNQGFYGNSTTTVANARLVLAGNANSNQLQFSVTDAGLDNKYWGLGPTTSCNLLGYVWDDLRSTTTNWLHVSRNNIAITSVSFPTGNVGVGTSNPSNRFTVVGTSRFNSFINIDTTSNNTPTTGTTGGTGERIILRQGAAGVHPYSIGTETSAIWTSVPLGGSHRWYINGSGMMELNNTSLTCTQDIIAFGSVSDRRLKENINMMESVSSLQMIEALTPVSYKWKDDMFNETYRGKSDIGFIAQDLETIIPEATMDTIINGEIFKTIKYERIVPVLVSAVQELAKQLKELKSN